MAQTKRSAKLDTRKSRRGLPPGEIQTRLAPGQYLLYRKPADNAAGRWTAQMYDPETRRRRKRLIGTADDYRDPDGAGVLSFEQAQRKAAEWFQAAEREALGGGPTGGGPFTVSDAMEAYFADGERRGMKGVASYRQTSDAWIAPALGAADAAKLTQRRIEAWHEAIAKSPRRVLAKAGAGPAYADVDVDGEAAEDRRRARRASANRVLAILKAALTFAADRRMFQPGDRPWRDVKRFRGVAKARLRFLTPTEQTRLINAAKGDFGDLLRGALLTGARYGELCRLQCRDYDPNPENPTLLVAESKSGRARRIYLTEEGAALFDRLTAGGQGPDGPIFRRESVRRTRDGGGRKLKNDQAKHMAVVCAAAGLEPITFHGLRHTYASTLVNKGVPLAYVAAQLGHAGTAMVERHYGHLAPSAMAAAIRAAMPTIGAEPEGARIRRLALEPRLG
jgi:integrase